MSSDDLQQQLFEPLRFIDPQIYTARRRKIIWHACIAIVLGLTLLIIGPILYVHNEVRRGGGSIAGNPGGMVIVAFLLPIYGIWRLLTMKSWIAREERARLIWLNPQLKAVEQRRKVQQKRNDQKPIILLIILLSIPVLTGLVFYILSIIKFAQS